MAGLSAGEVFVNLMVKADGVKPALQSASASVKQFGASVSAASVATGNLIADGVKFAFTKLSDLGKMAWDRAVIDPRTSKDIAALQAPLDKVKKQMQEWGVVMLSMLLPTLTMLADGLLWVAEQVTEAIHWFEQFGVVAALQTGDISTAISILWKEIQIKFLQGSSIILGLWDSMVNTMKGLWDTMAASLLQILGEQLEKVGTMIIGMVTGIGVAVPQLRDKLKPLLQVGQQISNIGAGVEQGGNAMAGIAEQRAKEREARAAEAQKVLQEQIEDLRKQSNQEADSARKAREVKRAADKAGESAINQFAQASGANFSGTSAILAGSGGNAMFQTQKDILREAKEQKELARKQLEEQKKIAKQRGAVFVQ